MVFYQTVCTVFSNDSELTFRMNGKRVVVKCFQQDLSNAPSVGSTITVKHSGIYANGTLKNPFYWRERIDNLNEPQTNTKSANVKFFLDFAARNKINEMKDWYNYSSMDIYECGGRGILHHYYSDSLFQALRDIYPTHDWAPWKFARTPRGYWKDIENQRIYFDWLKKQLGYKNMEDWYNLSKDLVNENEGSALLHRYYSGSVSTALQAVYPQHDWLCWKFKYDPVNYWKLQDNQRKYFEWLSKILGYDSLDDWHKLTSSAIVDNGGKFLNSYYDGSPYKALRILYPTHRWNSEKFM